MYHYGRFGKQELQTKGGDQTPLSQADDGRLPLSEAIHEHLISESMHYLGIPATRSLALPGSNTQIQRDTIEPAVVLLRGAGAWVRFGTLEFFAYRNKYERLRTVADFFMHHQTPLLQKTNGSYLALFDHIVKHTAKLISQWQSTGFCHGVLNTDNMLTEDSTLDLGSSSTMNCFDFLRQTNVIKQEGMPLENSPMSLTGISPN